MKIFLKHPLAVGNDIISDRARSGNNSAVENTANKTANRGQFQNSSHRYPAVGEYPCSHHVSPEAVTPVDAIKNLALSVGWTEKSLYQNRGKFKWPCGQDYGLVCYLGKDETIGEVTRQFIEIICPSGARHRFYNRYVEQPWIKKITDLRRVET